MLSTPRVQLGRLARLAAATLLAASALGVAPTGAAAKERPFPPPRDLTFYGRGWGHGVGMSQYGARGRALVGQTTAQILAHYYAGTTLGQRSPTTVVRVLVMTGFAATPAKPATVTGRGGMWTIDGVAGTFPADARLTLAPTSAGATTWTLKVIASTGSVLKTATVSTAVIVRPASSASFLELTSKASTANQYRGYLRIRLTTTVMVVNHVGLDLYLRGVVPAEMPSSWPAEALKAQAIAARSYAVNHLHPSTGTYDVYAAFDLLKGDGTWVHRTTGFVTDVRVEAARRTRLDGLINMGPGSERHVEFLGSSLEPDPGTPGPAGS